TAAGLGFWADAARKSAEKNEGIAKEEKAAAERNEGIAKEEKATAEKHARIAESRRLAALSDSLRPGRLDVALLLAVEASAVDTPEARGSLHRALDTCPEVTRFLHAPEGDVCSMAIGPQGQVAAGYRVFGGGGGGVVLFDARGERLQPELLQVQE